MVFDPNDMYKKQEGTTILPAQTTTPKVLTNEVQFKGDGSLVEGISQDYTSNRYTTVPSSWALSQALHRFQQNLNAFDPDHNFYKDNSVVTLPLIDPNFSQSEQIPWKIKGWMVIDGQAVYEGAGNNDNYLRIPTEVFTFPSYYHLNVVVDRLDSGYIRIYDHLNKLVLEIDKIGEYNVEMFIGEPDLTTLRIVAEDVFNGDIVRIDAVNLHLITDRFRDYFIAMLKSGDLVIGVDERQAEEIANRVANNLYQTLRQSLSDLEDDLATHMALKNAHGVTCDMIGAAPVDHIHTELGGIAQDLDELFKHVQTKSGNPHDVTYVEVGAAPLEHTHTPYECEAAPLDHNHDDRYLPMNALDNIDQIISEILSAKEGGNGANGAFLISSVPFWGVAAPLSQDTELWRPATLLLFPYNLHAAEGEYDYYSGYARSNTVMIDGTNAGRAFSQYWGETAKFSVSPSAANPVKLEYQFHAERAIKGYRLYKSTDADCQGFASSWSLKFGGTVVDTQSNSGWSTLTQGNKTQCYTKTFDDKQYVSTVLLEVSGASVASNSKWGVRVEFVYDDVPSSGVDGALDMIAIAGQTVNFLNNANDFIEADCSLSLTTFPTDDSPVWLIMKREMTYNPDNQVTLVMHQIQPDTVEPAYSQFQSGKPELMDKYPTSASHALWGNIVASSANPAYPARNIYSTGDNFYLSESSSLVVLTHTFQHDLQPSAIVSMRFKWSAELIAQNWMPKSIRVTVDGSYTNDEGNKVAGARKVIDIDSIDLWKAADGTGDLYLDESWEKSEQMSNISSVKIELNYNGNRPGQTAVGISEFRMYIRGWWASPVTKESSNSDRMPYGRLEKVSLPASSLLTKAVQHVGYPLNKIVGIPIEHFSNILPGEYTVPNPFTTTDVDISAFTNLKATGTALRTTGTYNLPAVEVISVTPKDIKVQINIPGRYGLKVVRQW